MDEFERHATNEDAKFYADPDFTQEITAEEAEAMAAATNYSYSALTSSGVTIRLIRTACSNIQPRYLNDNLLNTSHYGINAGFFSGTTLVNFAMWNNASIRTGGDHNGRGEGVLTWDGSKFETYQWCTKLTGDDNSLRTQTKSKYLNWVIGGVDLLPGKSDWKRELDQVPSNTSSIGRTGMIGKLDTGYVHLVISTAANAINFRQAMCDYHGIKNNGSYQPAWGGLILDGGGSSQMQCADYSYKGDGRAIMAAVTLINKN